MTMLTPRSPPSTLAPPGRDRRERKAAELERRTRLDAVRLAEAATRPVAEVLEGLGATPEGLSRADSAHRLELHGRNEVAGDAPRAGPAGWPRRTRTPSSPPSSSWPPSWTRRTPPTRVSSSSR
ncbi:cation-transporting P-type ATPase [Streptomyces sp. NPDC053429]|uniref:cation-transporting P-type ATPase n=1 Tax=Streptomyces sp. NPDC053429 TaxID=3365702 RepID=UPI0037D4F5A0